MTNSERFVQAHKNTRDAVAENTSLNYRVQFGFELAGLHSDEMDIEKMSIKELEELKTKITERIADLNLQNKKEFTFDFNVT